MQLTFGASTAVTIVAVCGLVTRLAQAGPADVAAAEALFREAESLWETGDHASACPKLAESQRLDPQRGTLERLGACYEATGKTASAWTTYAILFEAAQRASDKDRLKLAQDRQLALD